jgi:hypothetical protein
MDSAREKNPETKTSEEESETIYLTPFPGFMMERERLMPIHRNVPCLPQN